jgi:nucleotide-binding universal stress UspA family protein
MNERPAEDHDRAPVAHAGAPDRPALLCFDGSPDATKAILAAGALLGRRTAIVLSVWEPAASLMPLNPMGDAVGRVTGIYEEMDEIGGDLAGRQAQDGLEIAHRAGFRARALTAEGKPWVEILRVAEERDAAAIVLGARGLTRLSSIALGSVSARILHHSRRPVLVIPATGAEGSRTEPRSR